MQAWRAVREGMLSYDLHVHCGGSLGALGRVRDLLALLCADCSLGLVCVIPSRLLKGEPVRSQAAY